MTLNRPVRVCFVIENLIAAGTELWIVRLIERLDRTRVMPYLCILDGRGDVSRKLEPNDCEVIRFGLPHLKSPRVVPCAFRFRKFLRQHRVDVLQVHHADPLYFGVPVARLARVPHVVQTKYDIGYWLHGRDLWLHRFFRRFVDVTVANCQACGQAAIQQERACSDSVVVVENGIPLEAFEAVPGLDASPGQGRPPRVGLVGNLRPIKDPETFVRAAQLVRQAHPTATFHLAGEGPSRPHCEKLIQQLGLQGAFTLHGSVADIPAFLAQLDVAVLCSRSEGLPHAILEYMAAGRPTVASAVGGNVELVEDGVTGYQVPPQSAPLLADAINRLLQDPQRAAQFGRNARRCVRERYSIEAMVERFESFYEGLVNPHDALAPVAAPTRQVVPQQ